jgi:hypothetical protein
MKYINFHKPKCFIYLIIIAITRTITDLIRNYGEKYFKFPIFRLFLLFCGQAIAIIFYLIQILSLEKQFNRHNYNILLDEQKIINHKRHSSRYIFFFITLLIFLSELQWKDFIFNYEMLKVRIEFIRNLEILVLFFLYIIAEKYLLEMNTYRHHYLAIGLNIFSFIIIIIYFLFNTYWTTFKVFPFICVIIFIIESQFFRSICYTIIKKLNHEYFINMNYILCIMGIIGIIYTFIFDFIHSNILKYDINFYNRIYNLIDNKKEFIFIIIVYMIFICILNILNLKVIEETKPSYLAITNGFTNLFVQISHLIQNEFFGKHYKHILNMINIIFALSFFLSFCIFSEIISLNFCELDKYINEKISERSNRDTLNVLSNEFSEIYA